MSTFATVLRDQVQGYIKMRHALGYGFRKQASILRAFQRYVETYRFAGPLTQKMALEFSLGTDRTPNGCAICYAVLRCFSEYLAIIDARTEALDPRALRRFRAIPPPRILNDDELARLMSASARITPKEPHRGRTLATLLGLLASTGLRSGEALRLDRADVDLVTGVLHIRKTKFRKDRLVPVHATTLTALQRYAKQRDLSFPVSKAAAFFLSVRGTRLSSAALYYLLGKACARAGLNEHAARALRPHDLRHRFAVVRLAEWHRQKLDVQAQLPVLATYLGHARYTDTAYYVTAAPELLSLAAQRAFGMAGGTL